MSCSVRTHRWPLPGHHPNSAGVRLAAGRRGSWVAGPDEQSPLHSPPAPAATSTSGLARGRGVPGPHPLAMEPRSTHGDAGATHVFNNSGKPDLRVSALGTARRTWFPGECSSSVGYGSSKETSVIVSLIMRDSLLAEVEGLPFL